ncbi:MAG TPA: site-specific integrase, partial [Nakamurella sp.]|nr:site-specific integrase [Nakamurella sp.]
PGRRGAGHEPARARLPHDASGACRAGLSQGAVCFAVRVRPHRLRHTFGTELATAGIDVLVLRDLMGHANPETTGRYVNLSVETLATEYGRAREAAP